VVGIQVKKAQERHILGMGYAMMAAGFRRVEGVDVLQILIREPEFLK
jgi:hypothetical protein